MSARARESGRLGQALYRTLWVAGRAVTALYWRLEIIGLERMPRSGAFVLAPVHRSNLDFFIAGLASRRQVMFMAKDSIFLGGLVDRFLGALGAYPVKRGSVDREAIRRSESHLAAGRPVVIFPEGRRRDGPLIEDLFDGPAFIASRQRVPIVPIGIGGSDRAMPIGAKMVWPRKVVIVVGEPIYPDVGLEGRASRTVVSALTEELALSLQSLYDEAQEAAGQSPPA